MSKMRSRLIGLAALSSALAAPVDSMATKEIGTSAQAFTLSSAKFEHQSEIPALYTCDGKNVSPPLSWSGEPAKARSLALIVEDPDAAEPPKRASVQWIVFDIPVVSRGLREGVQLPSDLPRGAKVGLNEWKRAEYNGPCPPAGRKHHYLFKLFALDTLIDLDEPTKTELEDEMRGHIVARAELIGTYQRQQ
jgi:Raf kinase inhibitor-like YbhB/YbcL family protein